MRRIALSLSIGLLAVGLGSACNSDSGAGDSEENVDGWTAETGTQISDTGDDEEAADTKPEVSEAVDTETTQGEPDTSDAIGRDTPDDTDDVAPDVSYPMTFGPGSLIRHFYIDDESNEREQTEGRCCYDYESEQFDNGTENDNAVADLIEEGGSVVGFDLDTVNSNINQRIEDGLLIYLFEYADWSTSEWANDDSLEMTMHRGTDTDASYQENLDGDGSFEILQSSYDSDGEPKSQFATASTSEGILTASDGLIVLELELFFGIVLELRLKDPRLKATVVDGADLDVSEGGTVPLEDGQLAGKVPKADIYEGFNKAVATCGCLGGKDLLVRDSGDEYTCNEKMGECSCAQELEGLIDGCPFIRGMVADAADYDTNDRDGTDALSIGATFDTVGAQLVGTTRGP